MFICSLVSESGFMKAALKFLKTYNVPASRQQIIEDFEEICKGQRMSQSSIIVSLITKFVKDNRQYLSKDAQKKLELTE